MFVCSFLSVKLTTSTHPILAAKDPRVFRLSPVLGLLKKPQFSSCMSISSDAGPQPQYQLTLFKPEEGRLSPSITTGTPNVFHLPASLISYVLVEQSQIFNASNDYLDLRVTDALAVVLFSI